MQKSYFEAFCGILDYTLLAHLVLVGPDPTARHIIPLLHEDIPPHYAYSVSMRIYHYIMSALSSRLSLMKSFG